MTRSERLAELVEENEQIIQNGFEVPAELPLRYMLLQKSSGDAIWASLIETLEEAAQQIDNENDEYEWIVYDLDSEAEIIPIRATIGFFVPHETLGFEKYPIQTAL